MTFRQMIQLIKGTLWILFGKHQVHISKYMEKSYSLECHLSHKSGCKCRQPIPNFKTTASRMLLSKESMVSIQAPSWNEFVSTIKNLILLSFFFAIKSPTKNNQITVIIWGKSLFSFGYFSANLWLWPWYIISFWVIWS